MLRNFWLINYSLGNLHALAAVSILYHHHEENEASYAVWLSCSKYLSVCLAFFGLICIFVYKNGLFMYKLESLQ